MRIFLVLGRVKTKPIKKTGHRKQNTEYRILNAERCFLILLFFERFYSFCCELVFVLAEAADHVFYIGVHHPELAAILLFNFERPAVMLKGAVGFAQLLGDFG